MYEVREREIRDLPWSVYRATVVVEVHRLRCPGCGVRVEKIEQLPQKPVLLWNDGSRMQAMFRKLDNAELCPGPAGKGRNVWMCLGYVLASEEARARRASRLRA